MIIIGSTGITSTLGEGNFFCPQCGEPQTYRHRQVREFFTLYFIPLIPLGVQGRFIECGACRTSYDEQVLSYDPEAEQQAFFEDVKRILVLIMTADGVVDDAEIEAMQSVFARYGGGELTREEIAREAALARDARSDAVDYVRHIAADLSDAGCEIIVKSAFLVASATGQLSEEKNAQLEQLPEALNIYQEQFKAYIAEAAEEQLE